MDTKSMTPPKRFTFSDNAIRKMAARKMLSVLPMIICALLAAFVIANHIEDNAIMENEDLRFIFSGAALFFLIAGFFSGVKAVSKVLQETQFVLKGNSIEKQIPNGENTVIPFREILDFQESKNGIRIKTKDKRLHVPSALEEFDALSKGIRSHIHTHIVSYSSKFKIHQSVLNNITALGALLLLVGFFVAETKEHKLYVGIPLLLLLVFALVKLGMDTKNKHLERTTIIKASVFALALCAYLIYIIFFNE